MPQMAPLMWLFLMLMVVLVFGGFTMMNYFFSLVKKSDSAVHKTVLVQKDWRW